MLDSPQREQEGVWGVGPKNFRQTEKLLWLCAWLKTHITPWPIRPADEIYNAKPSYRHLVTSRSISAGPSEWWRLSGTCSGIQRLQSANQRSLESAAPCER